MNYHRCAANIDDGFVVKEDAVLVFEYIALVEGAGEAWGVSKHKLQLSLFVLLDGDDAVGSVDAGVGGHDGAVGCGALDIATDDIVAHGEGQLLPLVEGVFEHDELAQRRLWLVGTAAELNLKLFLACRTNEYQYSVGRVFVFVKGKVVSATGTG